MEWNIPLALRYRKRVKNAKFNVTIEIVKSISVSIKFSQQAYAISRNVKLSWIIEMAFSLSPLSLSHFPFKINPIVENMHSTASDEALLASSVFRLVSSVQTAHGSSRSKEDFRPSYHLLNIAGKTLFLHELLLQSECQRSDLQQMTVLATRFWLVIMAASWTIHGSRWAICFWFYAVFDSR